MLQRILRPFAMPQSASVAPPAGPPAPLPVDARIYSRRFELTSDLLIGRGLEIGPGAHPQQLPAGASCTYFDKLDAETIQALFHDSINYDVHPMADIPAHFPNGADFLIAHNVLEHSWDPIGMLRTWFTFLRDDGLMVISLPERLHCPPDTFRARPSLDHLVLDHLFSRGEETFESREHIYSFLIGWRDHVHAHFDKNAYLDHCLAEAERTGHDLHWHAISRELGEQIIQTAGLLSDKCIEIVRICDFNSDSFRTNGEVIFIFRVRNYDGKQVSLDYAERIRPDIERLSAKLASAANELAQPVQARSVQ